MKKTIKKLLTCIMNIMIFGSIVFASELFFSPSSSNLKLYCPYSVDVKVNNADSPISAVDMILTFSSGEIENYNFTPVVVEYNSPVFNEYEFNSDIWTDTRKFGGTRLTDWVQNTTIKHVWRFDFTNKNAVTGADFGFYALPGISAGDSNLWYNSQDMLDTTWSAHFDFWFGPCTPDTQWPQFPNSFRTISNGANGVASTTEFDFRSIDQSNIHADYRFQSFPLNLTNYVLAPAQIDNQYGVDSWTILVTIEWKDYSTTFSLNWANSFDTITPDGTTRQREDKAYDVHIDPIQNFRVEEAITITLQSDDNIFLDKTTRNRWNSSLVFNRPQKPYVLRSTVFDHKPGMTEYVDPEIDEIFFHVEDAWAGINSGLLEIILMTWSSFSADGGILGVYSGTDISLSWYLKTYINNWAWSQNISHDKNYKILLTGFGPLPENSYIWVITSGVDLAPWPNSFAGGQDRFVFKTRQSCKALQCGEWVLIFTWWRAAGTEKLYLETWLAITWWYEPYISGMNLICNWPKYHQLDLYQNGTTESYGHLTGGNVFWTWYEWAELKLDIRWGSVEIVGNTIYFTPTPPLCGNWTINAGEQCDDWNNNNWDWCNASCIKEYSGWGGWAHLTMDNCQLPYSKLPWANRDGIDGSPSYYDRTCIGEWEENETEECSIPSAYDKELIKSYKYACELWLTDDNNLENTAMLSSISRIEIAQMLSEFATKVFMKEENHEINCQFDDMKNYNEREQNYAISVCQLWLMWLEYDGNPAKEFNPTWFITRAEFGTVFSRLLYWKKYNGDAEIRYRPHLNALKMDGIMTKIDEPDMLEQKWYVMLMLQRSDHSNFVSVHTFQTTAADALCSYWPYGEELEDAFIFACNELIIDEKNIEDADMYGELTRETLSKMLTVFSIHVLHKWPDRTRDCYYLDMDNKTYESQYYAQAACELNLMWLEFDGSPARYFNPDGIVNRAEFGTVFSRLLRWWLYNGNSDCRYCWHLNRLKKDGIMTQIDNPLESSELKWYVMLMMERAKDMILR